MKLINNLPAWLKNKYLLATLVFLAFLLFFDDRDLITNYHHRQELVALEKSKEFYQAAIKETNEELNQLRTDAATLEKYAREKYLMKRENEEIFLVPEQD